MIKYESLMRKEARGCHKGRTAKAFVGNFRGVHWIHTAENVKPGSSPWY